MATVFLLAELDNYEEITGTVASGFFGYKSRISTYYIINVLSYKWMLLFVIMSKMCYMERRNSMRWNSVNDTTVLDTSGVQTHT